MGPCPSRGRRRHGRRGAVFVGLRGRCGHGAGTADEFKGGAAAGAEPRILERLRCEWDGVVDFTIQMGDLLMALNRGKWGFVWVLTIQNRDFVGFEPCKSGDLIGFKRSNGDLLG